MKSKYLWDDDDGDVECYVVPKTTKIQCMVELGRVAVELGKVDILHCDIKPSNILVARPKKNGRKDSISLKLIDFGEGNTSEKAIGFVAGEFWSFGRSTRSMQQRQS